MGGPSFILGVKDTPAHVSRNGYIPKLRWIGTKFILLWDESDKRGWLVNGTTALLHIVRASLAYNSKDKFKAAFMFRPEDIIESDTPLTSDSAIDVLINPQNKTLKLYQENDSYLSFQSRVEQYYQILEKLIDHQADVAGEEGARLANKPRQYLEGWDFRDLATCRDPLYPRATTVDAKGKVWVDLTRVLHTVILFGRGFGELIKPAGDICEYWAEMPKQEYYVAASLCDVIQVINNNNCYNDGHVRLSESTIWHTPTALFGYCQCRGALGRGHCEPVQTLLPSTMLKQILPRKIRIPEESSGAVIFGHHSAFPWIWGDYGPPEEGDALISSKTSDTDSFKDSGFSPFGGGSNTGSSRGLCQSRTPMPSASSYDVDTTSSTTTSAGDEMHSQQEYTVGILCALPKELLAVRALFDKKHANLDNISEDINHYALGEMERHMVVAACLPKGDYGTNPAADSASNMKRSFPNIKFCLLVGIGGGVPSQQHDIRLGDVVVSSPTGSYPGVIQYDRGKENENSDFERTGFLRPPPGFLMTAISRLLSNPDLPANPLAPHLGRIAERIRGPERLLYRHPGQSEDRCMQAAVVGECPRCPRKEGGGGGGGPCAALRRHLRSRRPRATDDPAVFYGLIASGNRVIKDAHVRNEWARQCDVLCFEMEAAGIMNTFPCLVIRGICDYADAAKNKVWQEYAASTAAAYAKLLLGEVSLSESQCGAFSSGKRSRTPRYADEEDIPGKRQRVWRDLE
jgi:nucleoside phosphorylase